MRSQTGQLMCDVGILLIRIMLGVVFVFHGSQKLFGMFDGSGLPGFTAYLHQLDIPAPQYAAVLAAASETLGGLALIFGFQMRAMMVPLATTMLVAAFVAHKRQFANTDDGMEYPLTLAIVTIGLGLTGPGRFSVGALVKMKRVMLPDKEAVVLERQLGASASPGGQST